MDPVDPTHRRDSAIRAPDGGADDGDAPQQPREEEEGERIDLWCYEILDWM